MEDYKQDIQIKSSNECDSRSLIWDVLVVVIWNVLSGAIRLSLAEAGKKPCIGPRTQTNSGFFHLIKLQLSMASDLLLRNPLRISLADSDRNNQAVYQSYPFQIIGKPQNTLHIL